MKLLLLKSEEKAMSRLVSPTVYLIDAESNRLSWSSVVLNTLTYYCISECWKEVSESSSPVHSAPYGRVHRNSPPLSDLWGVSSGLLRLLLYELLMVKHCFLYLLFLCIDFKRILCGYMIGPLYDIHNWLWMPSFLKKRHLIRVT